MNLVRTTLAALAAIASLLPARSAFAGDWPTFAHDLRRSHTSDERLEVARFARAWEWKSAQMPLAAWGQPAKGDAYSNLRDFQSMRNYDPVFHPIVVGERVYFGSNVDDTLRCLDAKSGAVVWAFTAGGPIRIAPSFHKGQIYFGADDGFAYCLKADTGELVWRTSPSVNEPSRLLVNDGRVISFWPCRSGVAVDGETAYFACSLLPWKPSFLCAVDAATGKPEGDGRYVRKFDGLTLEGALVAGAELLYSPQGRESPLQFRRSDGELLGTLGEGFGVFCVLTPQDRVLHGPLRKAGGIADSDARSRAPVATHKDARAMIVLADSTFVMLTATQLVAGDMTTRKLRWTLPQEDVVAMIVAGDALVLGQKDRVTALALDTGKATWTAPVDGRAYGLAAASGALFVSTETGRLVCFRPGDKPQALAPSGEPQPPAEAAKPKPIPAFADDHLLDRWVFSPLAIDDGAEGTAFKNFANGSPAKLSGTRRMTQGGPLDAVQLDGTSHAILVAEDHSKTRLPQKELTAEAWVRIDRTQQWGGIVGATQDNGSYERGWLLGFRDAKFSLSVAAKEGPGSLTYLTAVDDFPLKKWRHVAGTYDGTTMRLYVDGQQAAISTEQRGELNYPPRAFYEIGAYHDDDEHYRTEGAIHEVRVYDRALSPDEIKEHFQAKSLGAGEAQLAIGPWMQFDSPSTATVRWRTASPSGSRLLLADDAGITSTIEDARERTEHELKLQNLRSDRRYAVTIEAESGDVPKLTRSFELDSYFNFNLPQRETPAAKEPADRFARAAKLILSHYQRSRGLCVVVGSQSGELAIELARRHDLRVVGLESDAAQVAAARRRALELGVYGSRCSFVHVESFAELPLPSHFANLVVSQAALADELKTPPSELARLVQPEGGRLIVVRVNEATNADHWAKWLKNAKSAGFAKLGENAADGLTAVVAVKKPLAGAADWTHMYGDATNAAYAGEALGEAKGVDDLEAVWLGRPGPRYQTDRQNRKSSPLFSGGRLYLQGQERVIAVDGYNGVVLWSLEVPDLLRFNIPRDACNWCCDKRHLYIAVRKHCWQIDGDTGAVVALHPASAEGNESPAHEWGYVARAGDLLIGSAVRPESSYQDFWGGEFWFDQHNGPLTYQVCSDELFAVETAGGKRAWTYDGGVVWNATIAIGDGRVYFIESTNKEAAEHTMGRIPTDRLGEEQSLVALDVATGRELWRKPIKTPKNLLLANTAFSDGRLVLVTSADKQSQVKSFAAASGEGQWDAVVPWPRADHGGHLSRPAIVGERLFIRPAVLELSSGKLISNNIPGGGCGTYVCAKNALFFRAGSGRQLSSWQPDTGEYKHWPRLRPDCWLSTIPAGGMLLSPEGGGGCSCGHWMEMSIGFQPTTPDES